jgi:hypothetical protein
MRATRRRPNRLVRVVRWSVVGVILALALISILTAAAWFRFASV